MGLDAGFHGVLVPYCETVDEVREVVNAVRLHPLKGEGYNRVRDGGEYPSEATRLYLEKRNENVVVIIGIESVPAADRLDAILDVPGIDAIFIGLSDLGMSVGTPGQYSDPRFVAVVERIIMAAQARGIAAGGHWLTEADVMRWMAKGLRFVLFGTDSGMLAEGYRGPLATFRGKATAKVEQTV